MFIYIGNMTSIRRILLTYSEMLTTATSDLTKIKVFVSISPGGMHRVITKKNEKNRFSS